MSDNQQLVLVTGGTGFIAGHCVLQLLDQGYRVRTTVRSPGHVASPVVPGHVTDEDAVIGPARDGALRVLRAARDAGIERVVLTSAFHAVGFGHPHSDHVFTEEDWSVLDGPGMDAYGRSKVLAERAAWDFVESEGHGTALTTILPVAVMGPVMGKDISGSNHIEQRMLAGRMPGLPNLWIPIVDVRDVARAHLLAMTTPRAAGQRILVSGGSATSMKRIGAILKEHLGDAAGRVPTRGIPDFVVRLAARFNAEFRSVAPDLGHAKKISGEKARALLGLEPRDPEDAIVAATESMIHKSLVDS